MSSPYMNNSTKTINSEEICVPCTLPDAFLPAIVCRDSCEHFEDAGIQWEYAIAVLSHLKRIRSTRLHIDGQPNSIHLNQFPLVDL